MSGSIVEWRRAERDEGKGGGAFEEANERDIVGRAEEDGMVIQLHKTFSRARRTVNSSNKGAGVSHEKT